MIMIIIVELFFFYKVNMTYHCHANFYNLCLFLCFFPSMASSETALPACNSACSCSDQDFFPVCGSNDVTYTSPCHAGCKLFDPTVGNSGQIVNKYFNNYGVVAAWWLVVWRVEVSSFNIPFFSRPTFLAPHNNKLMNKADKVISHNPPLLSLPDHALPVLNHDRTDYNT